MNDLALLLFLLAPFLLGTLVQIGLEANARPKGRDLELLTASAPDEVVLAYRVCGARFNDVQMSALTQTLIAAAGTDPDPALDFVRETTGGIWVGGRIVLTSHRIVFLPNGLNRVLQDNLSTIALALPDVSEVRQRFGLATALVDISSSSLFLTLRGYRMRSFVKAVEEARRR